MQELIWLLLAESVLHARAYMVITCGEYASCNSLYGLLAESMLHARAYMVITCGEYASCKSLYGYYLRRVCFMQ